MPFARSPGPKAARLGISFRGMDASDMPFLEALYRSTRDRELSVVPWSDAEKARFLALQFAAQHDHYQTHYPDADWLILSRGGEDIGRLYIEEWPTEFRIIDIALLPAARGSGAGTAILGDVTDQAAASGKSVGIHVEKVNPAMGLYMRLGFRVIEDKGVYDLLRWNDDAAGTIASQV